jgi:quercetin dioxygenase-like cupin family protein
MGESAPMAKYRALVNPATGETYQLLETARETAGRHLRLRWTIAPGGRQPAHYHPGQDESYLLEKGETEFRIGRRKVTARPGERVSIPKGVRHKLRNRGSIPAEGIVELTPALDAKGFFEATSGLAREGRTIAGGVPRNPLQIAVFTLGFSEEFRVPFPPFVLQRIALAPLAALARRLGYRKTYERYQANLEQPTTGEIATETEV